MVNFITLGIPVVPKYKGGIVEPAYRMSNDSLIMHYLSSMRFPAGALCLTLHVIVATLLGVLLVWTLSRIAKRRDTGDVQTR